MSRVYNGEYEIDLFANGVARTLEQLRFITNDGVRIEGGRDLPLCCGVLAVNGSYSHAHVSLEPTQKAIDDMDYDEYCINYCDDITPMVAAPDYIPEESKSPFSFSEGESGAPGVLGKALRAYGEAAATLSKDGNPVDDLTEYFKASWGIPKEYDTLLKTHLPVVRSKGAAFWGGYNRNLRPITFAYPAAQAKVKVKFHNVKRTTFSEDSLINWPRVSSIIRAIASQVLVDDRVFRAEKRTARLDYCIVPSEIPKAPKSIEYAPFKPINPNVPFLNLPDVVGAVFSFIEARSLLNRERASSYHGEIVNLTLTDKLPEYLPDAVRTLKLVSLPTMDEALAGMSREADFESLFKLRLDTTELKQVATWSRLYNHLLEYCCQKNINALPRVREIKGWLADMDFEDKRFLMRGRIQQFVIGVCTKDFLSWFSSLSGICIFGDRIKWLVDLLKSWSISHGVFRDLSASQTFIKCIENDTVLKDIVNRCLPILTSIERNVEPVYTKRIFRLMANAGDFGAGVNVLFRHRANYWANRYFRNAVDALRRFKQDRDFELLKRCVKEQCRAKAFRKAKFSVTENFEVIPDFAAYTMQIRDTCEHWIAKRVHRNTRWGGFSEFNEELVLNGSVDDLAITLTGKVPIVAFKEIPGVVKPSLIEFCEDIRKFLSDCLVADRTVNLEEALHLSEVNFDEEGLDDNFMPDVEPTINRDVFLAAITHQQPYPVPVLQKDAIVEPVQHDKVEPTPSSLWLDDADEDQEDAEEEDDAFGGDMEDSEELDNRINIQEELQQNIETITEAVLQRMLDNYGTTCLPSEWATILSEAKEMNAVYWLKPEHRPANESERDYDIE